MSKIQAVLDEFMPCGGDICPGCEVACKYVDGRTPVVDRMADAIIDLRAERDALRKDAARYRWLKPQLEMDWDLGNPVYLSLGLTVEVPTHVEVSFDLDATIDAAMAVQPTTGETDE